MKKYLRFLLIPASLLLLAGLINLLHLTGSPARFERISNQLLDGAFAGDSLSLHYTFANPPKHITEASPATLPIYSRSVKERTGAVLENVLHKLDRVKPNRLNSHDRYLYSLTTSYLKNELEGASHAYYEEPLSPTSGMQSQLTVLLAEYTFRTEKDITDYLEILESVPAYLESLASYEKDKAAAGLFMTQEDARSVIRQCDAIMDSELLNQGTHFLQTTFAGRLDRLIQSNGLSAERRESYIQENDRLLCTVVAPAYTRLGDSLYLLEESGTHQGGLCELPEGREWYLYLLRKHTGSSLTPDEIRSLLTAQFQKTYEELQSLVQQYRSQTGTQPVLVNENQTFPLQNTDDILADLRNRMIHDFPAISQLTETMPVCRTETVSEAMEEYTSPAFYFTPPVDALQSNVIYVNNASTAPGVELYTTLAHEGYPGHLFQTVYSQLYENSLTDNRIRSVLNYGGFVEGWAYYVENLSYGYAADLILEKKGSAADALLCRIACAQRNLQINLYCLLDLSIHYYGASFDEVGQTLAAFGITAESTVRYVYDYIRNEPVTYLKYYLGYLQVLALRSEAQTLWGESYTPLKFHTFMLKAGPSDYDNLLSLMKDTDSFPYRNQTG